MPWPKFLTHIMPFWCLKSAECIFAVTSAKPFEFSWLPPFIPADCHLSFRLIATFQCGWLPFLDSADATLCLIWPEFHITLAWVPIYSFGLGAVAFNPAWAPQNPGLGSNLFIRPGCRCIDSADAKTFVWIQPGRCCYLFGLGAISFQCWQVGHSFPASSPFYP